MKKRSGGESPERIGMYSWMMRHGTWLSVVASGMVAAFAIGWMSAPTCFLSTDRVEDFSRFWLCYSARPNTEESYRQTIKICGAWGWDEVVSKTSLRKGHKKVCHNFIPKLTGLGFFF